MQRARSSHHRRRLHRNRSPTSIIIRSRFVPSFPPPLSGTLSFFFVIFLCVSSLLYFFGPLSSSSGGYKGDSAMRLNSSASSLGEPSVSCTTFNILAPIYKRLDQQNQSIRESHYRTRWIIRNQRILDWLLNDRSTVICLQEFWIGNEELVQMYQEKLSNAGYTTFQLPRTNGRGDGLLTAIHKDAFKVLNHRELLFNDCGDRVAQLLHIQSVLPSTLSGHEEVHQEILIVNTHLLFPHDSSLSIVRLHQVYKILEYLETYQKDNELNNMPIILCGDWNGSKRGHVYKFLRSQGFVSSYDIAHQYTDSDADAHRWVSHRNHRGNICGVDFIWLRNPSKSRKPLKTSWAEAVFGIIKYQLQKANLTEEKAFGSLRVSNHPIDYLTYPDFCKALQKVNSTGLPGGLSFEDTKDLWLRAHLHGNDVPDYEECKVISTEEEDEEEEAMGLKVKKAVLFPRETERGMWPENYTLSDHARLTVEFSPVRMLCS